MFTLVVKRKVPTKLDIEEYTEEKIVFIKKEVAKEFKDYYNSCSDVTIAYIVDEDGNMV